MNAYCSFGAAASLLLLGACQMPKPAADATTSAVEPAWVASARDVSTSVPPKLLTVLMAALEKSGPAGAIGICKEEAPGLARAASAQTGWQVRRVSLGNRNPMAVPDAWERKVLEEFDRGQKAGVAPARLERWEAFTENGKAVRRYMRALPTQALCEQCHGTPDKLGPGVAERVAQLYPNDRGAGYELGQIRGAMTLRQTVLP